MHPKLSQSSIVKHLDNIFYKIWFNIWFESLDKSASSLMSLKPEKVNKNNGPIKYLRCLGYGVLGVLMTPIGVLFYAAWFILFRKFLREYPYKLSVNKSGNKSVNDLKLETHFEVLSMNVCLLPETASKVNNLHQTKRRASSIGNLLSMNHKKEASSNTNGDDNIKVIHDLAEHNKDFDFICLQEVWSIDVGKKLCSIMHNKYDYIVYDVAHSTFKLNKFIGMGSGLFIASKYPIVSVDFKQFTNKCGFCQLAGKGYLICKVNIYFKKSNWNISSKIDIFWKSA